MEKKSKKSIVIGITSLFLVMLILLGLTYAYYRTRIIGNESTDPSISVTSKTMEVTYADGNAYFTPYSTGEEESTTGEESGIEPGDSFRKEFSVKNTGDQDVSYSVILDEMTNEFMRNQDWQVTLTKNGEEVISADDNVYLAVGTHQVLLGSETIEASTTEEPIIATYVLTLTYVNEESIDQSEDMGMELTFRVNISEETYTWEDAPSGSLLYALKANQPEGDGETVPGQAQSTENEARILTTEDDYGTSYVYRGNVDNNYVNYSGMCWRIVRVQGDGTIKLVLADGNNECSADVAANEDGTYSGYNKANEKSAFITDENGSIINTKYSNDDGISSALFENSNIPEILSAWALNKGIATKDDNDNLIFKDELVETEWCNDASIAEDKSWGEKEIELENGDLDYEYTYDKNLEGYTWFEEYEFGSSKRLRSTGTGPSLKCNFKSVELYDKSLEATKATRYKNVLGILSADEVIFAGEVSGSWQNELAKHYLNLNATGKGYWTMSPESDTDGLPLYVWSYYYVEDDEKFYFSTEEVGVDYYTVRPSIVLRSDVLLSTTDYTQNGTQENPYVIG